MCPEDFFSSLRRNPYQLLTHIKPNEDWKFLFALPQSVIIGIMITATSSVSRLFVGFMHTKLVVIKRLP